MLQPSKAHDAMSQHSNDCSAGGVDDLLRADVHDLLRADVGLLVSEFEEALEWVDAEVNRMLKPKRHSAGGAEEGEVEIPVVGGKGTAYGALVGAAAAADWDEVTRLLEQPGQDLVLRPWQRVADPEPASDETGSASCALDAAAMGGHDAMLLYLMYKTAVCMKLDAKPGDTTFCSVMCEVLKCLPAGPVRARADYAFRALVMLRGQHAYTARLDQLCAAVGEKQAWMDEEDDGLYSACFGDLKVNAELGRAVARELDAWIASCVGQRRPLGGLGASDALTNSIIFAIKSVQHQFDRVDKLARPRLSKPSGLGARWRKFVQQVERSMGEREGLAGQRLSDLLSWPLQRSMRYKDLLLDLIHGAACCSEGGRNAAIGLSGVTPRVLLDAIARDPGMASGGTHSRAASAEESQARSLAMQLADRIRQADASSGSSDVGIGGELVGALGSLLRVKDETMLLNRKVAEASGRQESADKALFYLEGMLGAEQVISNHCEFVAHSIAVCRLPEGPGNWSQGKTLKLLLLRGTRRQLIFYSEVLGVSGPTRTCVLKVDMSSVISISEPHHEGGAQERGAPPRAQDAPPAPAETFTMTLRLGSSNGDEARGGETALTADLALHARALQCLSSVLILDFTPLIHWVRAGGEGASHGGKIVTSRLTLTSLPVAQTVPKIMHHASGERLCSPCLCCLTALHGRDLRG